MQLVTFPRLETWGTASIIGCRRHRSAPGEDAGRMGLHVGEGSVMAINLSASDRADIARIVGDGDTALLELLAQHFIAVGLERAAARCDQIAAQTQHGHAHETDDGSAGHAQAFKLIASAIRALK